MKFKYLEARPDRASGEFTIKGTRIRIAQVINMLANGSTLEQLHEGWPWLSVATLTGRCRRKATELSECENPCRNRFINTRLLLDEHLYHRRVYPLLNEHFDVKHIKDDLHHGRYG